VALDRKQPPAESAGRGTRLRFGVRFALAALLCGLGALILTRVSERSWARLRLDWTRGNENTLEPAALEVLAQLPDEVTIDVFFRAERYPLEDLAIRAQERVRRLLYVIRDASGGRVRLVNHDLSAGRLEERSQSRLAELGAREVEPGGLLGLSAGRRRALVKLRGDIADFDEGDPQGLQGVPRPPALVSFRGEEALVNALLRVARSDSPRVCFTTGHGEFDLQSAEISGLTELGAALEADGFQVQSWDAEKTPELPEDCRVLASIGPVQPFTERELSVMKRFVERGGRFLCAPSPAALPEQNSLATLLAPWGLKIVPRGLVCRPRIDVTGQPQYGSRDCAEQVIDQTGLSRHPVVEPLRRSGRRVSILNAHAFEIGRGPAGGTVTAVLRSADGSWLDLPLEGRPVGDWKPSADEDRGPFVLAAALEFPPQLGAGTPLRTAEDQRPFARVFAFGASPSLVNANLQFDRDLVLNAFNWAASRDWRVSVSSKKPEERRLDLQDESKVASANFWIVIALPLSSLLLGLFTAWRRRR
jgi:hypothetical protein